MLNPLHLPRLYRVNTLFNQRKIVRNFSNMKKAFFWQPVGGVSELGNASIKPVTKLSLPETYCYENSEHDLTSRLHSFDTTSLLVMHEGKIEFEQYYLGTRSDDKRISWSVAKSILSALFGIAVDRSQIPDLNQLVTDYVPLLKDSGYEEVSIRHVLNMASGVKFNEDYLDYHSDIKRMGRVLALGGSMDEFTASFTIREREAGSARQYISIDTHVLAMVLRAATGKSLMANLWDNIWSKIGTGEEVYYLTDGDGVAFALGGLNMTTRDFGRFGQLMLNNGKWENDQIVSQNWVKESTRVSAPKAADAQDDMRYGYQWWIPPARENIADEDYYAVGVYGQYIYINPRTKIVIVKTAADRNFRNDGTNGRLIKHEHIAMFRAICAHFAG